VLKRLTTDTLNWIIIIGVLLFVIEIAFFHGGLLWSALFFGALFYVGRKKFDELWGKVFYWIGLLGLIITILNMIAVRFLIIVFIVLFFIDYLKSKNANDVIQPVFYIDQSGSKQAEPLYQTESLFKQLFFGQQRTSDYAYEWHDINVHGGVGDRTIDLTNTVLPNDTVVISIRQLVGNITIYLPYETEFSIHHSAVFGRAFILNEYHTHLFNQLLSYKSTNYDYVNKRVKIVTTLFSGNVEVRRK